MDKDLIIVARPANGFRRCGVHHPARQERHRAGAFSPEEIAQLKGEPQLVVIEVDPQPEQEAGPKPDEDAASAKPSRGGRGAASG